MKKIFISGNFNVLHAGHIRLFRFAKNIGGKLYVGVNSDKIAGKEAHVKQNLRIEVVKNNPFVDQAILIKESIKKTIYNIKPDIIVKGKEHNRNYNIEEEIVKKIKAKLVFSSGETIFSSKDLINKELAFENQSLHSAPNYLKRYKINSNKLKKSLSSFSKIKVCVVGDIIIDEYINCEALGMSQEEPTLVIKPVDSAKFIGGAAIVSAHASSLGCKTTLLSIIGDNQSKKFIESEFKKTKTISSIIYDPNLSSVIKKRFRTDGRSILRVNEIKKGFITKSIENRIINKFKKLSKKTDLLVFSDFNYGFLTKSLVSKLIEIAKKNNIFISADSQSSSQNGDLTKYVNTNMLTPTEHEARQCLQNFEDGLIVLSENLRKHLNSKVVLLKLGKDGIIIHSKNNKKKWYNDRIKSLNSNPIDVAGAGDAMLITSSISMALNNDIWLSAYLGSIAAAVQVGKIGNQPIKVKEILSALRK